MRYLALVLLITAMAFSQPCENWECDSTVVRELLDSNWIQDYTVDLCTDTNSEGRISRLTFGSFHSYIKRGELLGRLVELEYLRIGHREEDEGIEILPDTICSLIKLKELDLNNALTSLPDSIGRLKNLEYLDVSNNNLTEIPGSIGGLESLTLLYVNNNKLTGIPSSISNLKNLVGLHIYENDITEFPPEILDLDSLKWLDFGDNNISEIPEIWNMPTLEIAAASNNPFTSFPDMTIDCADNFSFFFQYNIEVDSFPQDMSDMKIHYLDLGECGLDELPPQIAQINGLKRLSLQYNNLTTLPYELMENDSLRIFVEGNLLNDIPDTLKNWLDGHSGDGHYWADNQRDSVTGTKDSPRLTSSIKTGIALTRKSNNSFNLSYSLNDESRVDISVYDISGRLVKDIFKGTRQAGNYSQSFKTSGLSAGAYYLRVLKEGSMSVRKFVVMR